MFSFKERFGVPGVLSVIALVFAMAGGAYAAKRVIITELSQIKPSVQKKLRGNTGPQGPAGAAGAQGAKGATGPEGKEGKQGAKGATGPEGKEGKQGAKGATGPEGKQGLKGEQGKEGSPWTAGGTLPSGKTETGAWTLGAIVGETGVYLVPLSFPIPLPADLEASNVHYVFTNGKELDPVTEEFTIEPTKCTGTVSNPTAAAGNLCVYTGKSTGGGVIAGNAAIGKPTGASLGGASKAGAQMGVFAFSKSVEVFGTWAVTAP